MDHNKYIIYGNPESNTMFLQLIDEHDLGFIKYLYCKGSGAAAKGFASAGGFTVLAGSTISDHIVPSMETRAKTYYKLRNSLIKDGTIIDRSFTRDYEFNAPSAASAVILGHSSNGNVDWKTADGTKLKDI